MINRFTKLSYKIHNLLVFRTKQSLKKYIVKLTMSCLFDFFRTVLFFFPPFPLLAASLLASCLLCLIVSVSNWNMLQKTVNNICEIVKICVTQLVISKIFIHISAYVNNDTSLKMLKFSWLKKLNTD